MKTDDAIIKMTNVVKTYKSDELETTVLSNINLSVQRKEFLAITGRSGSGKSTLMHIIGLLDTPTSGTYVLNGTDVSKLKEDQLSFQRNREIGFVFQSFNLLQRSSALENVILPSIYAGMKKQERTKRASELLKQFGLEDHMYKRPNQMSGGQQQRIAIARALMNNPEIILADEPTGNLDSASGEDVINTLIELNKNGKTIILITHDHDIAKRAERIVSLVDGVITKIV